MKKYVVLILIALLLTACTSGKTEFFPTQGFSADAAEVTVIRKRRMFGMGFSMQVLLDGEVIPPEGRSVCNIFCRSRCPHHWDTESIHHCHAGKRAQTFLCGKYRFIPIRF